MTGMEPWMSYLLTVTPGIILVAVIVMLLPRQAHGVRILVLTGCRDREIMLGAVRLGVHGYVRKGADTNDILRAVHTLLRGAFTVRDGKAQR